MKKLLPLIIVVIFASSAHAQSVSFEDSLYAQYAEEERINCVFDPSSFNKLFVKMRSKVALEKIAADHPGVTVQRSSINGVPLDAYYLRTKLENGEVVTVAAQDPSSKKEKVIIITSDSIMGFHAVLERGNIVSGCLGKERFAVNSIGEITMTDGAVVAMRKVRDLVQTLLYTIAEEK
jgi:hypothetical protein